MKYCTKAHVNLFLLICKLLQGSKIWSDNKNNIVVEIMSGDIILDCQIKTHNGWVVRVKFLQKKIFEEAHMLKSLIQQKANM